MNGTCLNGAKGGIGLCGSLTIAFVVLKLIGAIHWKWIWVLSPALISALISLVIVCLWAKFLKD